MKTETVEQRKLFMSAAEIAVFYSGGRLRIAFNEQDESVATDKEAAHFLKLDGKRLGRDLELYAFMLDVMGAGALADFIAEVLVPLRPSLSGSYRQAAEDFKTHGREYVPDELAEKWNNLF